MPDPPRYAPDDPREWLNRARSDLALAKEPRAGVYLEDLCFHAQQAAEKAIKAVLLGRDVRFPYTHDIAALLKLVRESGVTVPPNDKEGEALTAYGVAGRYPGMGETVVESEHKTVFSVAANVVEWADALVSGSEPSS